MIIIFIELCRIADSLLWIPKSSRRTSSIFYIPNIIALINNGIPTIRSKSTNFSCIPNIIAFINNGIPTIISTFPHFSNTEYIKDILLKKSTKRNQQLRIIIFLFLPSSSYFAILHPVASLRCSFLFLCLHSLILYLEHQQIHGRVV